MIKKFCINADVCGRRHYQYPDDEPALCGFCEYEETKNKAKEVVMKNRNRSDTVANFEKEEEEE